jgi:hypothetical protein
MSSAHPQRKKVLAKIMEKSFGFVIPAGSQNHLAPEHVAVPRGWVQRSFNAGKFKSPADWHAFDVNVVTYRKEPLLVGVTGDQSAQLPLAGTIASMLEEAKSKNAANIVSPTIYKNKTKQLSKSVFEVPIEEFDVVVGDRSVQLAQERWDKGLPLSIPAGKAPNEFVHIYKGGSSQLVILDETTGKVKATNTRF